MVQFINYKSIKEIILMENFNEIGLVELEPEIISKINGGSLWRKLGGWVTVAISEVADVITSGGDNLAEAYQNGREAVGAE